MRERLQKFMKSKSYSANAFAEEINVQPSSVSHVLSGRNNPSYDFITKILLRFKELNADWLLTGRGEMYKSVYQTNIFQQNLSPKKEDSFNKITGENNSSPGDSKTAGTETNNNSEFSDKIDKIVIFYENGTFKSYNQG